MLPPPVAEIVPLPPGATAMVMPPVNGELMARAVPVVSLSVMTAPLASERYGVLIDKDALLLALLTVT